MKRLGLDGIEHYVQNDNGLQCCKCDSFACVDCLTEIISVFPKGARRKDKWCRVVRRFLVKGFYPDNFVGHCCELKEKQKRLGHDKIVFPKQTRFDGHLYLPQFAIMIDSPFDCVDVHGLGGNKSLPVVWHCVFSHTASEMYHANDVVPDGRDVRWIDPGSIHNIEIKLPYANHNKLKVQYCCVQLSLHRCSVFIANTYSHRFSCE
jgi:hypothetical protein